MSTQNQIKRTLSESAAVEYIRGLIESNELVHRSQLAERVCEHFRFYDARGQQQWAGCLKALRDLEAAGQFVLPVAWLNAGPLKNLRSAILWKAIGFQRSSRPAQ